MIRVGTSGWSYPEWRAVLYPRGLPAGRWLAHYAQHFGCVELNASFYRLPAAGTFARWRDAVPAGFLFAVKAHRLITHRMRLADPAATSLPFLAAAAVLGDRLGPVLFQLPPRFPADPDRLAAFLAALPPGGRYAFEFRDPSWQREDVHALLARHDAALCISDLAGRTSPIVATARLVYVRLHGPRRAYAGRYGEAALAAWAGRMRAWTAEGREVFCFFDNTAAGDAVRDATRLIGLLGIGRAGG